MSVSHSEIFSEGFLTVIILSFIGGVGYMLYLIFTQWISPFIMNNQNFVVSVVFWLLLLVVVSYVVGYIETQLLDDIEEWREQ